VDLSGKRPFPLRSQRDGGWLTKDRVSRIVCRIGRTAGVKVSVKIKTDPTSGKQVEEVKYASAHEVRRSFGERWSGRVMPQVLKELMRYESIETTLRYYVGRSAQTTADAAWAAYEAKKGTVLSTARQEGDESVAVGKDANCCETSS